MEIPFYKIWYYRADFARYERNFWAFMPTAARLFSRIMRLITFSDRIWASLSSAALTRLYPYLCQLSLKTFVMSMLSCSCLAWKLLRLFSDSNSCSSPFEVYPAASELDIFCLRRQQSLFFPCCINGSCWRRGLFLRLLSFPFKYLSPAPYPVFLLSIRRFLWTKQVGLLLVFLWLFLWAASSAQTHLSGYIFSANYICLPYYSSVR